MPYSTNNPTKKYQLKQNVNWFNGGEEDEPKHNQKHFETKMYWNEFKGKWCSNPSKKEIVKESLVSLYNFNHFTIAQLKKEFDYKEYEKAAMFLTLLYQLKFSSYKSNDHKYIYWSDKDLRKIIAEDWTPIISKLKNLKLIQVKESRSNYDTSKKLYHFRISDKFNSKDGPSYEIVSLKDPSYQDRVVGYYEGRASIVDNTPVMQSILSTLNKTNCVIEHFDALVEEICNEKIDNAKQSTGNDFLLRNEVKKNNRTIANQDGFKSENRNVLQGFYSQLNIVDGSKSHIEKSAYLRLAVEKFGYRISHIYSNVPREFRRYMTIEGEPVVEIDINASQPSFFCVLIKNWHSNNGLKNKENVAVPDLDDTFYEMVIESEILDFYKIMALKCYGAKKANDRMQSRSEMKKLFYRLMYGNPKHDINGESREYWITKIFNYSIYEFVESIAKTNLEIGDHSIRKNLSALLQREESAFLMRVMEKLVSQNIRFLPLYDSLIVKKSDKDKVENAFLEIISAEGLDKIIRIK